MTRDTADSRWYLYDIVAEDDALLYVGKTNESLRRLVEHLRDQPWAEEVCDHRRVRRVYASEPEVLAAERDRIARLRPRFNIQGNQHNPDRVDPRTMRYLDGAPYRPDLYPQPFHWNSDGHPPRAYRAPLRGGWAPTSSEPRHDPDAAPSWRRAGLRGWTPTRYARRVERPQIRVSRRQRATIGWAMLWATLAGGGWYAQVVWAAPWAGRVRPLVAVGVATLIVAYLLSLSRRRRQRLIERAIASALAVVALVGVAWWARTR